jgi:two-component system, NarL family, response regulator LiaR
MMLQPISVLVVDDHAYVRKGMKALLNEYEDICMIGEAANGLTAIELAGQLKPDVILIDIVMPGIDGIETIRRIIANKPDQKVIVLTAFGGEEKLFAAVKAGAIGYLLKDAQAEELVQAIRSVSIGEPWLNQTIAWMTLCGMSGRETKEQSTKELSDRELEVLRLLALGKTDPEMAEELCLEEVTIRSHMKRILSKLGVRNRVEAVLFVVRSGLVSLYDPRMLMENSMLVMEPDLATLPY